MEIFFIDVNLRKYSLYRKYVIGMTSYDIFALSLRAAWEWDIAAGALIAERAGARVTDRRGQPMRFNSEAAQVDGLIVAGARLHGDLLAALR